MSKPLTTKSILNLFEQSHCHVVADGFFNVPNDILVTAFAEFQRTGLNVLKDYVELCQLGMERDDGGRDGIIISDHEYQKAIKMLEGGYWNAAYFYKDSELLSIRLVLKNRNDRWHRAHENEH